MKRVPNGINKKVPFMRFVQFVYLDCDWFSTFTFFLMLFVLLDCDWFSTFTFCLMLFVLLDCDFILHYSFSDVVCVAGL